MPGQLDRCQLQYSTCSSNMFHASSDCFVAPKLKCRFAILCRSVLGQTDGYDNEVAAGKQETHPDIVVEAAVLFKT